MRTYLSTSRFSFLKGLSTVQQLLEFHHEITNTIARKSQMDIMYFDIKKAVDSVAVDSVKQACRDLGVYFSSDLSWSSLIDKGLMKAYCTFLLIKRSFPNTTNISVKKCTPWWLMRRKMSASQYLVLRYVHNGNTREAHSFHQMWWAQFQGHILLHHDMTQRHRCRYK